MHRREFLRACGCCALAAATTPLAFRRAQASPPGLERGFIRPRPSPFFEPLPDGAVRCTLCPRRCAMAPGERGHCEVRQNQDGTLLTLVYGNPCAVNVDPVEKKPFYHVLPGSASFSIATAGCNLDCVFCQNHEISQARPDETMNYDLPPEAVTGYAANYGCRSVAHTYVEPTIFMEYLLDIGALAQKQGLRNVMHSSGYVNPEPLERLCDVLDAACIDLKGFSEDYYREMTGGRLAPVLESLELLRRRGVHLELVTLLVPGKNDDPATLREMCSWIRDTLGPDTPLHFSRFYPMYRLQHVAPTAVADLERARDTAREAGLDYVYIGNVSGHEAQSTRCPGCDALLVHRDGYRVRVEKLAGGACAECGRKVPGIWS